MKEIDKGILGENLESCLRKAKEILEGLNNQLACLTEGNGGTFDVSLADTALMATVNIQYGIAMRAGTIKVVNGNSDSFEDFSKKILKERLEKIQKNADKLRNWLKLLDEIKWDQKSEERARKMILAKAVLEETSEIHFGIAIYNGMALAINEISEANQGSP